MCKLFICVSFTKLFFISFEVAANDVKWGKIYVYKLNSDRYLDIYCVHKVFINMQALYLRSID